MHEAEKDSAGQALAARIDHLTVETATAHDRLKRPVRVQAPVSRWDAARAVRRLEMPTRKERERH